MADIAAPAAAPAAAKPKKAPAKTKEPATHPKYAEMVPGALEIALRNLRKVSPILITWGRVLHLKSLKIKIFKQGNRLILYFGRCGIKFNSD